MDKCEWRKDYRYYYDDYTTSCGNSFDLPNESHITNVLESLDIKYCCFCGKEILEELRITSTEHNDE